MWNCRFGQDDPNNKSAAGAVKAELVARMVGVGRTNWNGDQKDNYAALGAEPFATYYCNGKP